LGARGARLAYRACLLGLDVYGGTEGEVQPLRLKRCGNPHQRALWRPELHGRCQVGATQRAVIPSGSSLMSAKLCDVSAESTAGVAPIPSSLMTVTGDSLFDAKP
jgi:hypothetical protein